MDVSQVTAGTSAMLTGQHRTETLGKDDFLRLLVTQMTHQDPLNPMKDTEFIAQLAQFSSLEQMQNLNTQFAEQSALIQSLNNNMAAGLVGRMVSVASDTVELDPGTPVTIGFQLGEAAARAVVEVYDAAGTRVETVELSDLKAGGQQIEWDGLASDGSSLAAGRYRFQVTASDAEGAALAVRPLVYGRVESVAFENGGAYVTVAGVALPLGALVEVLAGSSSELPADESGTEG